MQNMNKNCWLRHDKIKYIFHETKQFNIPEKNVPSKTCLRWVSDHFAVGVECSSRTAPPHFDPSLFCHGSWVPGPILTVSCLYACAYVWAGVCGCVWLRLIRSSWESSPLGYISSCHALPLVRSLQFAVDVYEAFLVPGFRDSWALLLSWTPIAGDSPAHCFPALPASAPTESSVSAYGKLRFCLRKAPPLPYGSSASALRKAPFSFSLCITSCNKLSFSATESSRLHCDIFCSVTHPRGSRPPLHSNMILKMHVKYWIICLLTQLH